jgi:hypothetical protein
MIITNLANTTPYVYGSGNAGKLLGPSLPEIIEQEINDTCICDFITCEYVENVFAHSSGDWWKNDMNEFLFKRFVTADTVAIELYKDDVKVADLNDNTLGTFFNGFALGSAEQQLYVGFLLDWNLVLAAHGVGKYQVKAQLNIVGLVSEYESRQFKLTIYSDEAANATVRIESTQNGNIIGSQFDFTDLNWYQSLRIPGIFGNPTPIIEVDNYVDSDHNFKQIGAKNSREWSLKTKPINYEVATQLIYNKLIANQILITDYLIKAESLFRRVDVLTSEIEKPELGSIDKIYNITFTDKQDKFKKRNY